MPRKSQPRWDKTNRYWYARLGGKKKYLAADESSAWKRFHELGGTDAPTERPVVVSEAIAAWARVHGDTWHKYVLKAWDAFAGTTKLKDVDRDHLTKFAKTIRRQAPATIRHKIKLAHRVLRWCEQHGWIDHVSERPRLPKPQPKYRDEPVDEITAAFVTLPAYAKAILGFVVETGCRPGEACRLTWEMIDLDAGVCSLPEHKTAHEGDVRTIYLTPGATAILQKITHRTGHVFRNRSKRPYTPNALRCILRRRGINSVYSLRHTRAQTMLDSGVPLEDVQKILGHKSIAVTQIYAQVRDPRALSVANSLTPLVPEPRDAHTRRQKVRSDGKRSRKAKPASPRKPTTRRAQSA